MNWLFRRPGPSGFSFSSTAEEVTEGIDASGLTAIVTGASSGIGSETARVLALRGAHVVMAVRNVDSGNSVKETIIKEIGNAQLDVLELDLSSMASVRDFASNFKSLNLPLNILINNAGIMASPFQLSQDGIELQFATNHIGHFLLTYLLLEDLKKTAQKTGIEGRIINVSSEGHRFATSGIRFDQINEKTGYYAFVAYGQSKLANILHANELTRRFQEEGVNVTANSIHPGSIPTNLLRYRKTILGTLAQIIKFALKNIPQGASTQCYVALHPRLKGVGGKYFSDNNEAAPSSLATNTVLAKKLWEFSEKIIS